MGNFKVVPHMHYKVILSITPLPAFTVTSLLQKKKPHKVPNTQNHTSNRNLFRYDNIRDRTQNKQELAVYDLPKPRLLKFFLRYRYRWFLRKMQT